MNLPADFIERTKPLLKDEWENFIIALQKESPVSIRVNKEKYGRNSMAFASKVPWCNDGYYLLERPQFTFDPLFHAGCYYVQEASSMFIEQAIRQYAEGDIKVLDLCAAPGGKSTLLAGLLSKDSLLVSNEVIRSRSYILSENISKWGCSNVVVTNNDPVQIGRLDNYFDVILVDAPCSGEGMFRKDTGTISEWSVDNVKLCKQRQQRILSDVWDALKPGGLLLYSTCTYNTEENEDNVAWMRGELGAEVLSVETKEEWNITSSIVEGISAYRFFPHKTQGEGFFFALLRKNSDSDEVERKYTFKLKKTKQQKSKNELPKEFKGYIKDSGSFVFQEQYNNSWIAFPQTLSDDLNYLKSNLNIISVGIILGEFKGKDFIPNQSLALGNDIDTNAFQTCDIDWLMAISYLRKEPIMLQDMPRGYILLTYKDKPLGFVKNIGNRANNLYPQEWRIRSNNVPAEEVNVL
jgi:16S rRNA C967 or C1407 C5-methylase (RsmB/RsmF family)/NOL1/NOP2/fmu family ribosome biogenesis protein